LTNGIPAADDPIQAACQRNFTLLTTDGYWNYLQTNLPKTLGNQTIGNLDPSPATLAGGVLVDRSTTNTLDGLNGKTETFTPTSTISEQVICQGNNSASFTIGAAAPCGCGIKEHKIMQLDKATGSTEKRTNGVLDPGYPQTGTSTNYVDVTACVAGDWQEITQPKLRTEVKQCDNRSSGSVTFGDGTTKTCGACSTSSTGRRYVLIREMLDQNQVSTYVDGTGTPTNVGSPVTVGSPTYEYSNNGGSSWTTTPPSGSGSSGGCTATSYGSPPQGTTVVNNGSTSVSGSGTGTPLSIALSPNPATTTGGTVTTTSTAGGTPTTLADVALYYYQTKLRGGSDLNGNATGPATSPNTSPPNTVDLSTNSMIIKSGAKDFIPYQHMVTFGIGLADGYMRFQPDYETAASGDFANIKNGVSDACFWSSPGTCNWAKPFGDTLSPTGGGANLDDLWHAAVNGRGTYYQALNPDALRQGIASALNALNAQVAAAAASATSSPNVTQTENQIFSTTYETNTWSGRVFGQLIDPVTGNVLPDHIWDGDILLLSRVGAATDSRNILTADSAATDKVKQFDWASLTATEQGLFNGKCSANLLAQCTGTQLTATQKTQADDGSRLVGYLRGWQQDEAVLYRDRQVVDTITGVASNSVLGDTISAKPVYVKNPTFSYVDPVTPSYSNFVSTTSRQPRVYVGANDGYLHAFDGNTGAESWAYLPKFLMRGLYALADNDYNLQHRYFVDGSPESFDVFDSTAGAWKTILIGGAAGGGNGYYALDITNESAPKGLWEFCSDSTVCTRSDADLGLTYGNPVVGKRSSDGRWVAVLTSGLNNNATGTGHGYFYVLDVITGQVLDKVDTGVGSATTPSGLMKMSAFYDSAATDATMRFIYAGDQLGNVWRLDLGTSGGACEAPVTSGTAPCVAHIATLKDANGFVQPITTRPALTHISGSRVIYIGTGRYLGNGDLSDTSSSTGTAWQQTFYGFKDKNVDYGSSLRTGANLVTQTLTLINTTDRGITSNPVDWNIKDGWLVDFDPAADPSPGERVNIDPRLVLGTLKVATNTPSGGGACSVGGTSRLYDFDFRTGSSVVGSGGVVGRSLGGTIAVGMAIVQLPSGAIKDIVTGADTTKTTVDVQIGAGGSGVRRFSYRER
jgi:type IV pilus assembly protein PilY1